MNDRPLNRFSTLAVVALFSVIQGSEVAGQTTPSVEILNSERIEQTFGSFGIEVVSFEGNVRVSNLYSTSGPKRICRTFAVVLFPDTLAPELMPLHEAILAGGSIGETFQAAGWVIEKRHRWFGFIERIDRMERAASLMGLDAPAEGAVHVYVFAVEREGREFEYATIAEVHHPDYLNLEDLDEFYELDEVAGRARPAEVLETVLVELSQD